MKSDLHPIRLLAALKSGDDGWQAAAKVRPIDKHTNEVMRRHSIIPSETVK